MGPHDALDMPPLISQRHQQHSTYFLETLSGVSFILLFEECEPYDQPPRGQKQARKESEDGVRQPAGGCHQFEDLTFKISKDNGRDLGTDLVRALLPCQRPDPLLRLPSPGLPRAP
jgi:hypothetical protein